MNTPLSSFNNIVNHIYNLPLEDKLEIKNLLDLNISESKRNEIEKNYKLSKEDLKNSRLKFSNNIYELKRMI